MTTDEYTTQRHAESSTEAEQRETGVENHTTDDGADQPVVLVVEDQPAVAEAYRRMLTDHYTVHVATDGPTALGVLSTDVDVVLLDRMMPGMSGDEVLATIRERGINCRVAMVTAVEPDLDIVAMGFDAYVQKPPTRAELVATVEDLLRRSRYSTDLQHYCAALSKRATLRSVDGDVTARSEYTALEADIEATNERLQTAATDLTDDMAFLSAIRHIDGKREVGA